MRSPLLISLTLGLCAGLLACGSASPTAGSGGAGTTGATTAGTGGGATTTGAGGGGTTTGTGGGATTTTSTGAGGSPDPAADAACTAFASARCDKVDACTANTGVNIRFGTKEVCVARYKISCLAGLAAADTGSTVATTNACAAAIGGETCDEYFDGPPVAACAIQPGTRPAGGGCVINEQCASGFCAQPSGIECGTCAPTPQPGDSCAILNDCGYLACGKSTDVCVPLGTLGAACDKSHPCHSTFSCTGSGGGVMGTCQVAGVSVGAGCDAAQTIAPDCNHDLGLRCDQATNKCVVYQYGIAGQACGKINGGETICTGGSECIIPKGQSAGFCVGAAPDGGTCNNTDGPPCLRPTKCITGGVSKTGTCKIQDWTKCP